MTKKERKIEWLVKRESERKSREGMRVKVEYMKLEVEKNLWVWDEVKEKLKLRQVEVVEGG